MPQSEIHPQSPVSMLHRVFASSYHDMKALEVIADKVQKAFQHSGKGRLDRAQLHQALRGIDVFYEDDELAKILLQLVNTDLIGRGRDERSGKFYYYSRGLEFNFEEEKADSGSTDSSVATEEDDVEKTVTVEPPQEAQPCVHVVWKTRDGSGRMLRGVLVAIIPAGENIKDFLGKKSKNFSSVTQFDRRLVRTEDGRHYAPAVEASMIFDELRAAEDAIEAGARQASSLKGKAPHQAQDEQDYTAMIRPEEIASLGFLDAMEMVKARCEKAQQSMPEDLMKQLLMKAAVEIEYHEILKNSIRLLLNTVPAWASRPA